MLVNKYDNARVSKIKTIIDNNSNCEHFSKMNEKDELIQNIQIGNKKETYIMGYCSITHDGHCERKTCKFSKTSQETKEEI